MQPPPKGASFNIAEKGGKKEEKKREIGRVEGGTYYEKVKNLPKNPHDSGLLVKKLHVLVL